MKARSSLFPINFTLYLWDRPYTCSFDYFYRDYGSYFNGCISNCWSEYDCIFSKRRVSTLSIYMSNKCGILLRNCWKSLFMDMQV